ncbi:MAG TPA: guanylate kinase [Firmicutes bacterium]|nr:guanylate kinase [Bacillota bacterium]
MKQGLLVVLSGPSGVGKGTVCRQLLNICPEITLSVSMTTRPPRIGEREGVDYHFTSVKHFQSLVRDGAFLEWAQVYGHYYGTLTREVLQTLSGGTSLLLEIDIQGARQVRRKIDSAVYIFLAPPSREILKERIDGRGTEDAAAISRRLAESCQEMEAYREYDYLVVNDQVERAADCLAAIITAEGCKVSRGAKPLGWEVS